MAKAFLFMLAPQKYLGADTLDSCRIRIYYPLKDCFFTEGNHEKFVCKDH